MRDEFGWYKCSEGCGWFKDQRALRSHYGRQHSNAGSRRGKPSADNTEVTKTIKKRRISKTPQIVQNVQPNNVLTFEVRIEIPSTPQHLPLVGCTNARGYGMCFVFVRFGFILMFCRCEFPRSTPGRSSCKALRVTSSHFHGFCC